MYTAPVVITTKPHKPIKKPADAGFFIGHHLMGSAAVLSFTFCQNVAKVFVSWL
jgi:hypothetical protein